MPSTVATTDDTTLNLLTRDGAVAVNFCAKLSQEQYAQLFHFVGSVETRDEMRSLLSMIANEWNVSVEIDDA